MKRKLIGLIIAFYIIGMSLTACQANSNADAGKEQDVKTQTEDVNIESEKIQEKSEEEKTEDYNDTISYGNNNIKFSYPSTWKIEKSNHEDGATTKVFDEQGKEILFIEQGEAWRVNLEMDENDYKESLLKSYDEVEIIELLKTEIGGYEAQQLTFSYSYDGVDKKIKEYTVIVGYAFYKINILAVSNDAAESLVSSIEFLSE